MCGRFVAKADQDEIEKLYKVTHNTVTEPLTASYNIAPTDEIYAVVDRTEKGSGAVERQLRIVRWGLVPSWSKDGKGGAKLINARVETVAEKSAFKKAFATRRAIVPAAGYYEWLSTPDGVKQPYYLRPAADDILSMAGLYEFWRDPHADKHDPAAWLVTATIITTDATDNLGQVHDRAPMLVPPEAVDDWLDPAPADPELVTLLVPATATLEAVAVSTAVNSVRNNGPDLIAPVGPTIR